MLVGFMHRSKKPPLIAKVTALMGPYYGIDIIYFRPRDIDRANMVVKGRMFKNNKWISIKKKLPPLVDASSRCFKKDTREIINFLRENTVLTFDKNNTPNKEKLQRELLKDSRFAHIVIPTKKMNSFESLERFLKKYSSIIIKPLSGKQGKGLYSLHMKGSTYVLRSEKGEKTLDYDGLHKYYKYVFTNKRYILQKLIESKTIKGDPFDCRIVVQKNGKGEWVIAKKYFRVGIGQKIVSNTSQGGSVSDPKPFLKANYGEQWEDIYQKLRDLATTLPYKIEEIKRTPTMDLGLDIGIDPDGNLFLFESNNGASIKRLTSESAILRLNYYRYLYDSHPKLKGQVNKVFNTTSVKTNDELNALKREKVILTQRKNMYKKRLNQMKISKSWLLTRPLRKINSYIKKH